MTKFAIGIDLGGSHITAALVDQNGHIKARKKISFSKAPNGKAGIRLIAQLVNQVIRYPQSLRVRHSSFVIRHSVRGLGLACPGSVDAERGLVLADSPNLIGWKGTKVKQELEKALKIPVFIDNDANLAAWGEKCWGAGKGAKNLICLTLGTGVGGGIIIDNKIYRGSHFYAAEIGHMSVNPHTNHHNKTSYYQMEKECVGRKIDYTDLPQHQWNWCEGEHLIGVGVNPNGPLCSCGQAGHLEALVSGPAIVARYASYTLKVYPERSRRAPRSKFTLSPSPVILNAVKNLRINSANVLHAKAIFDMARKGDKIAQEVVNQTVYYLGIACASLINIFDPEMVVIGGGVANAGEILFKPLRQVVKASIMKHPYRKPLIVRAKLGEDAGLLGAAALVFSHMQRGVGR